LISATDDSVFSPFAYKMYGTLPKYHTDFVTKPVSIPLSDWRNVFVAAEAEAGIRIRLIHQSRPSSYEKVVNPETVRPSAL
jgi:hypothetical protein